MEYGPCQGDLNAFLYSDEVTPNTTFRATKGRQFTCWAIAGSLAVTNAITVVFFPPLINMLKFGGNLASSQVKCKRAGNAA